MDRVALSAGPITIYWYSIFIFLGIVVAIFLIGREAKKQKISEEFLINLTFRVVIFGILGARLYYVIFNLPYYVNNIGEIFAIWNGGLAIHGALIAGLIVTYISCKKEKTELLKMLDIIVVGLIIAQAIGRWGNFFNQEAYGNITTLSHLKTMHLPSFIIKGMYIGGEYREPTFLYESILCLIGFIIMIIIRKKKKMHIGFYTGFYLIWYGCIRFIIESMRSDSLMLGPIKMAQLVSIIFVIIGLYLVIKKRSTKNRK